MAQVLQFNASQASGVANKIKSEGDALKKNIDDLSKKIHVIQEFWVGESANKYIAQYENLQPDLQKLVTCMNEIGEQLNKIAKIKMETEQAIARQIGR